MTWIESHMASEKSAMEAEKTFRAGDAANARLLYELAAEAEERALAAVDSAKVRTRGITAVSAVALWFKAAVFQRAELLAYSMLADPLLPDFAKLELRTLVQAIWTEASKQSANVSFLPGQVLVSVKGGEVITGGAPLDLIVQKVQTIQAMFYRTIEFIRDMPLRQRGQPILDIQESCRPWLFQEAPGSYQFSVAIQEPSQRNFFREDMRPDLVALQFLQILQAASNQDQTQLEAAVPKADYRNVFLKLSRNLAPTGKSFDSIAFQTATGEGLIALTPDARATINQALKRTRPDTLVALSGNDEELNGILRAVDLDKDFLDVAVADRAFHVVGLGDAMDDIIGPMVNKMVKVHVNRRGTDQLRFRDIELVD